LDALARRTKEAELETWQRNLATLQAQSALHGMAPPIELVNEIETAKRNIKRVQSELDTGQEQSVEATQTGILELLLSIKRQQDSQAAQLANLERQMRVLQQRVLPTPIAVSLRLLSVVIIALVYTALIVPELRVAISGNWLASVVIILPSLALAGLLRLFAQYWQPVEVHDDDH